MCGIFGQINKNKQGRFNYPAFCTLGTANDVRGGDSCGIFIDKVVHIGVDKYKMFSNFILKEEIDTWLCNLEHCQIALGHCRKASVGAVDEEHAQPVIIKENGETKFVLIHNGTILNYKDLANQYIPNINITGMTDSQVIAHIIYHTGYDFLSSYIGGAAIVAVDYRYDSPKTFMFKGASKYSWYSDKVSEERPLYYSVVDDCLYFSSIFSFLVPFCKDSDVYSLASNTLASFYRGHMKIVQKYDRSECTQTVSNIQPYSNKSYEHYNSTYYPTRGQSYQGAASLPYSSSYPDTPTSGVKKVSSDIEGYYKRDNKPIHGKQLLTFDGFASSSGHEFFFWHGRILKNEACYNFLKAFCEKSGIKQKELENQYPDLINYFSMFPCITTKMNEDCTPFLYSIGHNMDVIPFSGITQFLGDSYAATVAFGTVTDSYISTTTQLVARAYNEGKDWEFNMETVNALVS